MKWMSTLVLGGMVSLILDGAIRGIRRADAQYTPREIDRQSHSEGLVGDIARLSRRVTALEKELNDHFAVSSSITREDVVGNWTFRFYQPSNSEAVSKQGGKVLAEERFKFEKDYTVTRVQGNAHSNWSLVGNCLTITLPDHDGWTMIGAVGKETWSGPSFYFRGVTPNGTFIYGYK